MASDYGLNFGFRRSDESMATREGRFKTPVAADPLLLQGSAVRLDADTPGYLEQAPADQAPISGFTGLLVQEESHIFSAFTEQEHDSFSLGRAKNDQLSVMWAGVGTKVWLRNTDNYSRFGRTHAGVQIVNLTGAVIGGGLGWNGTQWVASDVDTASWMTITLLATDYCEAVLTF